MTTEELRKTLNEAAVSCCFHPWQRRRLEPHLWEALRIRMQEIYRRSTGEADAVLTITIGESGTK